VNNKWVAQMPQLVDAYLKFKYEGPAILDETAAWLLAVLSFSGVFFIHWDLTNY
jgi:hypothetical protein